uniref:Diuretic-hormone-44 n=1 Tax=Gecarcinus lateralis TaxID=6769 RepID=A0AA50EVM2_GECLA|nr:diuretic-hormone-44 [Gecarcinus lateralis]
MFKRAWPHNFSRRRSSGLSLSIDASMKVLREALYLEIARKKQRQQLQRAQHNKALLNTIGKRDVASQLREEQHQQKQHHHGAAAFNDGRN